MPTVDDFRAMVDGEWSEVEHPPDHPVPSPSGTSLGRYCTALLDRVSAGAAVDPVPGADRRREERREEYREVKLGAASRELVTFLDQQGGHFRGTATELHKALGRSASYKALADGVRRLEQDGKIIVSRSNPKRIAWIALPGREPPLQSGESGPVRARPLAAVPERTPIKDLAFRPPPDDELPEVAAREQLGAERPEPVLNERALADALLRRGAELLATEAEFHELQDRYASAVDEIARLKARLNGEVLDDETHREALLAFGRS